MAADRRSDYQARINADTLLQQLLAQGRQMGLGAGGFDQRPEAKALTRKITDRLNQIMPLSGQDAQDYAVNFRTGEVTRKNIVGRNIAGIAEGTLGAIGGAAALTATPGLGVNTFVGPLQDAVTTGGGSSLLSSPTFWGTLAGVGSTITNAALQNKALNQQTDAADKAAQIQADATAKALELQRQMFNQQTQLDQQRYNQDQLLNQRTYDIRRNDLTPYRALGQGSAGKLGFLLGVPGFEGGPTSNMPTPGMGTPAPTSFGPPPPPIPTQPPLPAPVQTAPAGPAPGGPSEQMVMLQAPDGSTKSVPASQADFYVSRGARRV